MIDTEKSNRSQSMSDVPESAAYPPAGSRPTSSNPRLNTSSLLGCAFALSFALNFLLGLLLLVGCFGLLAFKKPDSSTIPLTEQHYSGKTRASDKIAIITLDGVILEGRMSYVHKQIEQAAGDKHVKAAVLRINSPGGSITASDDLHRRLLELRDGNAKKSRDSKPLVVSMGGMAASGGYYVAMPGQTLFAEKNTLTGSIGVFISFPNVKKLGDNYGVSMNTIKQGQIKDSGSPFADMSAHERQVWQDLVDDAYQQFLQVVETGRPMLAKGKLLSELKISPIQAGPAFLKKGEKAEPYTRYLADGGGWTAEKAKKFQLIDQIGTLDDAIQAAHSAAQLDKENYQAIKYEHPSLLVDLLGLSGLSPVIPAGTLLDPARLESGLMPRMWYLTSGAEASAFLAATRE
jgi:protease IV